MTQSRLPSLLLHKPQTNLSWATTANRASMAPQHLALCPIPQYYQVRSLCSLLHSSFLQIRLLINSNSQYFLPCASIPMWVSSTRLVSFRKFITHIQLTRFNSVSALAQLSPAPQYPISEEHAVYTYSKDCVGDRFIDLNTSRVVEIFNNLKNEPNLAWSFFTQLKESGFQHNVDTYAAFIRVLCRWRLERKLQSSLSEIVGSKETELGFDISALFEVLREGGEGVEGEHSSVLIRVLDMLVKAYVRVGLFDEAIDALFQTKDKGLLLI